MYDIIGDIHGYCSKLQQLLLKLGYSKTGAVWKHPERKVIFVGDYIDRGPEIKETLDLVKGMVDSGAAIALMGNHEYNAVAYATAAADGAYLRPHNAMHANQHKATLDQFADYPAEWQAYLDWFYTLPLFLDLKDLRVVHACWDEAHIDWLRSRNYFTLNKSLLFEAFDKDSEAYMVIEDTLKGKEYNIPEEYVWHDKDGHARFANRIKWWVPPTSSNFDSFLFSCPPAMKEDKVPADLKVNIYPADGAPVFFGHYWLEDPFPVIQAANVICLDYSVAKNGALVAYRWNGEDQIDNKHFVYVN